MTTRIPLVEAPTPIQHAPRLARALGLDPERFWVKRDDLIGLGGGGNKVRKLQYSAARALDQQADVLVTTGAPQSNHARLTAAAGARLGVDVVLVLAGPPVEPVGNLLIERLVGAELVWAGEQDTGDRAAQVVRELQDDGRRPYLIPFGGSDSDSAQGYADAADEIVDQVGTFDHIVVAVGSGGTMAGLVSRLGPSRVLGVHCGAIADARSTVATLLAGMGGTPVDGGDLRLDLDQVGDGYEHLTGPAQRALRMFAETEGMLLDPTYTGRAAAGLTAAVEAGVIRPEHRTVFLHSGGFPSLFAHPEVARSVRPDR